MNYPRGTVRRVARPSAQLPQKRRSKYGAQKTTVDGIVFDSKRESERYGELKLLEKAGEIWELELQPVYRLVMESTTGTLFVAAQALAGTRDRSVGEWRGDFRYHTRAGRVVEDVKGFRTPVYRLKKRMVEAQYNIVITEIR